MGAMATISTQLSDDGMVSAQTTGGTPKSQKTKTELTALQINVNHSLVTQDLAIETANKLKVDIVCISEIYKYKGKMTSTPGWARVVSDTAAILLKEGIIYRIVPSGQHVASVEVGGVRIISAYASPNEEISPVLNTIETLLEGRNACILAGDMNCRWPEYTRATLRDRDNEMIEFIAQQQLMIGNDGTDTCIHQGRKSTNDYTFSRDVNITKWEVLGETESLSDHLYIVWTASKENADTKKNKCITIKKKKTDQEKFAEKIKDIPAFDISDTYESAGKNAEKLTQWISEAVEQATIEKDKIITSYWWNDQLEGMKKECKYLLRAIHRSAEPRKSLLIDTMRSLRKKYRQAIIESKEKAWRQFIGQGKPWGRPYRVVIKPRAYGSPGIPQMKKADGRLTTSDEEAASILLNAKFPRAPAREETIIVDIPEKADVNVKYINDYEITQYLKKCRNRSSPGPDGINYKALKVVNKKHPGLIPWIMNRCLCWSLYPDVWKFGRAVMIRKNKLDIDDPNEYRPLVMQSTLGKLYEKCLVARINETMDDVMSGRQYGFRKKKSCEDCVLAACKELEKMKNSSRYVIAVSIDISGAFDHMLWSCVLEEMSKSRVPEHLCRAMRSYFAGRTVEYGGVTLQLEKGAPQGSVIGPAQWLYGYNYALTEMQKRWISFFCYADDTLMIFAGDNVQELERKVNREINWYCELITEKLGVNVNPSKTEIMLLGKKMDRHIKLALETKYKRTEVMKYLGVWIDPDLRWVEHCKRMGDKARRITAKMSAICRNTFGYEDAARTIMLNATAGALLQYCSSVFAHRLHVTANQKHIDRAHRTMLLSMGRLYRTVSYLPGTVICGEIPIRYKLCIRALLYAEKKKCSLLGEVKVLKSVTHPISSLKKLRTELQEQAHREWQKEWTDSPKGAWTKQLMPVVPRSKITSNFWRAQALSGHGVYGSYLMKFKRREDAACHCGYPDQSPQHVFTECEMYTDGRPTELGVGAESLRYMEEVVRDLWKIEIEENRKRGTMVS